MAYTTTLYQRKLLRQQEQGQLEGNKEFARQQARTTPPSEDTPSFTEQLQQWTARTHPEASEAGPMAQLTLVQQEETRRLARRKRYKQLIESERF